MLRKTFVCIIIGFAFFSFEGFSQNNSNAPTSPQMPQMPQIPAIPKVPQIHMIPAVPSVSPSSTNSPATKSSSVDKSGTTAEKKGLSSLSLIQALTGSGLGGEGDSLDPLSSLLGGSSTSADSNTIKKIQELLEKAENAPPGAPAVTVENSSPVLPTTLPYLERLVINKVNILSTITLVIPSAMASDGSFLLTGERLISANDGLSEMFYFMCRSQGGNSYILHVDLTQSKENTQSFLYQLVRKAPIKGEKIGDLVFFRFSEPNWQSDIVIRLPSALVQ